MALAEERARSLSEKHILPWMTRQARRWTSGVRCRWWARFPVDCQMADTFDFETRPDHPEPQPRWPPLRATSSRISGNGRFSREQPINAVTDMVSGRYSYRQGRGGLSLTI